MYNYGVRVCLEMYAYRVIQNFVVLHDILPQRSFCWICHEEAKISKTVKIQIVQNWHVIRVYTVCMKIHACSIK